MNTQSFFIKEKLFCIIKYIYLTIMCSQCKYPLPTNIVPNDNDIFNNTQITVILHSYAPFNTLTRAIQKELYLNNINIINNPDDDYLLYTNSNKNILLLKILCVLENRIIVSVFQDGTESEYKIFLEIQAQCCSLTNIQDCYPINVQMYRTLITDPIGALSNLIQENEIRNAMQIDAAQQLIQKFLIRLKN